MSAKPGTQLPVTWSEKAVYASLAMLGVAAVTWLPRLAQAQPQTPPAPQKEQTPWVLPPGLEERFLALVSEAGEEGLSPASGKLCREKEQVVCVEEYCLQDLQISPHEVRYRLVKTSARDKSDRNVEFSIFLRHPADPNAPEPPVATSQHFAFFFAWQENVTGAERVAPEERNRLQRELLRRMVANDLFDPWVSTLRGFSSPEGETKESEIYFETPVEEVFPTRWPLKTPSRYLQVYLVLALSLAGVSLFSGRRRPEIRPPSKKTSWRAAIPLMLITAWGLTVRLLLGNSIPGAVNGHGYTLVYDLLFRPPQGYNFHGNGMYALYELVFLLAPATPESLVAIQILLSGLSIPLLWAVCHNCLDTHPQRETLALVAALFMATIPTNNLFAGREERLVPGVFFLLCTLCSLAAFLKRRHPLDILAAALFGVVAASFQPFLLLTPLVAAIYFFTVPVSFSRLAHFKSFWCLLAAGIFLLGYLEPALLGINNVLHKHGPAALVSDSLTGERLLHLFLPAGGIEATTRDNVFFNATFTPLALMFFAYWGLVAGLWQATSRRTGLGILACAAVLTLPGMQSGNLNPARLQLAAQPFWCALAALGVNSLARAIGSMRLPLWRSNRLPLVVAVLLAGLGAFWAVLKQPALSSPTTMQQERAFFDEMRRLEVIPPGCRVVYPQQLEDGRMVLLPLYLHRLLLQKGRPVFWMGVKLPVTAESFQQLSGPTHHDRSSCFLYYRPAACFDHQTGGAGPAIVDSSATAALRPDCQRLEQALEIGSPLLERPLRAKAQYFERYAGNSLNVGLYFVKIRPQKIPAAGEGS